MDYYQGMLLKRYDGKNGHVIEAYDHVVIVLWEDHLIDEWYVTPGETEMP